MQFFRCLYQKEVLRKQFFRCESFGSERFPTSLHRFYPHLRTLNVASSDCFRLMNVGHVQGRFARNLVVCKGPENESFGKKTTRDHWLMRVG